MDLKNEQTPDKIRDEVRSALKSQAAGAVKDAASAEVRNALPAALRESLSKATPSWSKDGLGLRGKEHEKVTVGERTAIDSRLPTYQEIETPALEDKKPEEEETPNELPLCPLSLFVFKKKVWVSPGCVGIHCDSEIDGGYEAATQNTPAGWQVASGGEGRVWVKVCIDDDGRQESTEIAAGPEVPDDEDNCTHKVIGRYKYDGDSISVAGGGNVEVTICRNWFAAEKPFFGISMKQQACGQGVSY